MLNFLIKILIKCSKTEFDRLINKKIKYRDSINILSNKIKLDNNINHFRKIKVYESKILKTNNDIKNIKREIQMLISYIN